MKSTTIRIRQRDKVDLDRLCRLQHRSIVGMLAYLIQKERSAVNQNSHERKAG